MVLTPPFRQGGLFLSNHSEKAAILTDSGLFYYPFAFLAKVLLTTLS